MKSRLRVQVPIPILIAVVVVYLNVVAPEGVGLAALPVTGHRSLPPPAALRPGVPPLPKFVSAVMNGSPEAVTGVYVPGLFALPVSSQPEDNPTFVTTARHSVTQFGPPARHGTVGLLAHNYLSGALFFKLTEGQEVNIVYGDGTVRRYLISTTRRFQALTPEDPYSEFLDLARGVRLSSTELFREIYAESDRVVFQTCIQAEGNPSWGRLFVLATPIED